MPFYTHNGQRLYRSGSFAYDVDCCCGGDTCQLPAPDDCLCVDAYVSPVVRRVRDVFIEITGTPKFCEFPPIIFSNPLSGGPCDPVAATDFTGLYVLDCADFDDNGVNPNAQYQAGNDTYICTRFTQDYYVREFFWVRAFYDISGGVLSLRVIITWTSLPFTVGVGVDPSTFVPGDAYIIANQVAREWAKTFDLTWIEECEGVTRTHALCSDITGQMVLIRNDAAPTDNGYCDHSTPNTGYVISHVGIGIVVPA